MANPFDDPSSLAVLFELLKFVLTVPAETLTSCLPIVFAAIVTKIGNDEFHGVLKTTVPGLSID